MISLQIRILTAIAIALWSEATLADGQCTICRRGDSSSADENIRGRLEEHDRNLQTMHEAFSSAFETLTGKLNALLRHANESLKHAKNQDNCEDVPVVYDCSDVKASGNTTSGVYRLHVDHHKKRYYTEAFCDMTTAEGSWTVFQRRKDGSEDFYRDWSDYANGFGNASGEFWLGNDFLFLLTSKRKYRLRMDLEDFEGEKKHAEYLEFNISSSMDKYRLTIGDYFGDAGDSLSYHDGMQFSTKDSKNDLAAYNCALWRRGAWWYNDCTASNLNGLYHRGRYTSNCSSCQYEGITWYNWHHSSYSLKTTEMKIAPIV